MNSPRAIGTELIDWLARRAELAPASLRQPLGDAVRAAACAATGPLPELCSRAGELLAKRVLADGCGSRAAAPQLLAADALVTYAFEAASEGDSRTARDIDASAADSMARVAALGANS